MKKLLILGCFGVAAASNAQLNENFDGGSQPFTFTAGALTTFTWRTGDAANAHSGGGYLEAPQAANLNDTMAESAALTGTAGYALSFWHKRGFENTFDGGVVEININNAGWVDVGEANFTVNPYTTTISTAFGSAIGGQRAFSGTSPYVRSVVTLASLANGDSYKIRFRSVNDNSVQGTASWCIDDVVVGPPPGPTPTPPDSWNEDRSDYTNPHGDANELPATAQMTVGNGPLNHILGKIGANGDNDMFCIKITNPAAFGASTIGGIAIDSQLFLFKADGTGVAFNDDDPGLSGLQSVLTSAFTSSLPVGNYYLALSAYNDDPYDAGAALIWLNGPFAAERAPDGPGAANPVSSWDATAIATSDYDLALTGCGFCQPASVNVPPTSFVAGPGIVLTGGLTEAVTSDDTYLVVRPGPVFSISTDPVQVIFTGNAPGSTASDLKLVVEARASSNFVKLTIQAYKYTGTPGYVTVGTVATLPFGGAADSVSTITLVAADNIGAANEVKAKLSSRATGVIFAYPWKLNVDQVKWVYSP